MRALGLGAEQLPAIPPPTPSRLVSGNPTIDAASELMPFEQRRKLQQLIDADQLTIRGAALPGAMHEADNPWTPFPWGEGTGPQGQPVGFQSGNYQPEIGMQMNAELMLHPEDRIAQTLTHEMTHALQPRGRPIRDDLPPEFIKGRNPYRDNPLELEARLEAQRVKPAKRRY